MIQHEILSTVLSEMRQRELFEEVVGILKGTDRGLTMKPGGIREEKKRLLRGLSQARKSVLEAREGTIHKLPWNGAYGICAAVRTCIGGPAENHVLLDTFEKCPSFSGDRTYPVRHPNMKPGPAFYAGYSRDMWYEGVYADNRLQLLEEAIEILRQECNAFKKLTRG